MVVQFEQPVSDDQVRNALVASISGEQVIQSYGDASANQKLIRLPHDRQRRRGRRRSNRARARWSTR